MTNFSLSVSTLILGMLTTAGHGKELHFTEPVRQLNIESRRLALGDRDGRCALEVHGSNGNGKGRGAPIATGIPWPCAFHTDSKGSVRTFRRKAYTYALMESSRAENPKDCETHVQSVRISSTKVQISPHHDRLASCPPFQWDNILFTELFN